MEHRLGHYHHGLAGLHHGRPERLPWAGLHAGTRVMVSVVLDNLAAGLTAEEITESYPAVSPNAVAAALHYATELARERTVPLGA